MNKREREALELILTAARFSFSTLTIEARAEVAREAAISIVRMANEPRAKLLEMRGKGGKPKS